MKVAEVSMGRHGHYTFFKAKAEPNRQVLVEDDKLELARRFATKPSKK